MGVAAVTLASGEAAGSLGRMGHLAAGAAGSSVPVSPDPPQTYRAFPGPTHGQEEKLEIHQGLPGSPLSKEE